MVNGKWKQIGNNNGNRNWNKKTKMEKIMEIKMKMDWINVYDNRNDFNQCLWQ